MIRTCLTLCLGGMIASAIFYAQLPAYAASFRNPAMERDARAFRELQTYAMAITPVALRGMK